MADNLAFCSCSAHSVARWIAHQYFTGNDEYPGTDTYLCSQICWYSFGFNAFNWMDVFISRAIYTKIVCIDFGDVIDV